MRYYLTKYALTKGIVEIETDELPDENKTVFWDEGNSLKSAIFLKDIWKQKDLAIQKAKMMRFEKIKTLEKKIKKLEKLTFD